MRLGFVINQNTCIGCHACTVACKSEHQIPLGNFRTWVKYIEKGEFPDVQRKFAVMRCNHCDDAPCMSICPTKSLFRRDNGIVDFDSERCIGCKSCMQACPYDALYIDENTHTAAKCNFCAHRIDVGLEPACVVVCPVQAIGVGDLDDPDSAISKIAKTASVRKPERGTRPKTFYLGVDAAAIDTSIPKDKGPYSFAQQPGEPPVEPGVIREIYDVPHPAPWGWMVWSYLWTKSIAAGILFIAAALGLTRPEWLRDPLIRIGAPVVALVFITLTAALLVFDLKRPERFWYLMVFPNFSSWLVWGGYILTAFGGLAAAWLWFGPSKPILIAALPLSLAAAGYTAFLFWQAKGRVFWESRILLPHLVAQMLVAGAASAAILAPAMPNGKIEVSVIWLALVVGLVGHFGCMAMEIYGKHAAPDAEKASDEIVGGRHQKDFEFNVILAGIALPFVLLALAPKTGAVAPSMALIASLLALWGLYRYERMWILAGQSPPLS